MIKNGSSENPPARGVLFARRVFRWAGIYGILVLLPQYFLEGRIGQDYPPPITHPENFYGFIGVALAWQILFLIMSGDPVRFRPMMIPSVLEKVSFGAAAVVLYVQGRLALPVFGAGIVDLTLAAFFAIAFVATKQSR